MCPQPPAHPAALRGAPIHWAGMERILLVRPDNLGDVLMIGPTLRALRSAAPGARLELLTSPSGAAAVPLLDSLDACLAESVPWQDVSGGSVTPESLHRLVARLAARSYQAAVVFTSFSQSPWPAAYACALAEIPVRAGASREFGGALLTHWIDDLPDEAHQVDRAAELLKRLGVPVPERALRVKIPRQAELDAQAIAGPRPYAMLLPGASCASRRWPPRRFAELAGRLGSAGLRVLVAGTAREHDLVRQVCAGAGPAGVDLAGAVDLATLAALLRGAEIAVTNNSGGMHLADAVGVPLLALFAGTERESEYRPRSAHSQVLRRPTPCAPCRAFDCPLGHHECLDITAARVADVALALRARSTA
ncbi:lipopolysaccharide heptosyltransferase II [Parafrankia irregularis]|uniref:Lipopolysaccharide heptosyltransferase II n=2 Tax=Parafrankia TaxID=2994362 RepID=A0A0S4QKY9_9ACTN|nr:glycosyltransferase family 9 protein [Parafrankia sp. CH37]CUU56224.1 lipopolysaccharide heptosyltransferase II [Parafrankia irregularis]